MTDCLIRREETGLLLSKTALTNIMNEKCDRENKTPCRTFFDE